MAMKWATMTKEQKQIAGFAAFCFIIVLYAGYFFGMAPALEKTKITRVALEDAELEFSRINRAIKSELKNKEALAETTTDLKKANEQWLPDSNDPLSWASALLGGVSRKVGVSLSRVEGVGLGRNVDESVNFGTYGVTVVMSCSYFNAIKFIETLRAENPYSTISKFSIRDGMENELHKTQINIEWPTWRDRESERKLDL